MIQIANTVVSLELFKRKFLCDLSHCKGECCYEGDSGAPLEKGEAEILDEIYPLVEPYLTPTEKEEISKQGKWVVDSDGDKVTPIINGRECVYTYREPDGTWKCAIERAFLDGKISFQKPVSCHLYPIRVAHYRDFDALNFHEWHVCEAAMKLGDKVGLPVYKFLKEPLIRMYGEDFYRELESLAPEIEKELLTRKKK